LVEEVKDKSGVSIANEDVFMATAFGEFLNMVVSVRRGGSGKKELEFEAVKMHVNKMDISFATQLFIDGQFVNATSGRKLDLFNPHDESLICKVESAGVEDVDKASGEYQVPGFNFCNTVLSVYFSPAMDNCLLIGLIFK